LAIENKLPAPPFAGAAAFGSGPVPVWRIHAEAKLSDGVTFVREAVVRSMNDVRRPLVALAWTEGVPMPPPPPVAAAAQSIVPFMKR
jgi:hypothetical protein